MKIARKWRPHVDWYILLGGNLSHKNELFGMFRKRQTASLNLLTSDNKLNCLPNGTILIRVAVLQFCSLFWMVNYNTNWPTKYPALTIYTTYFYLIFFFWYNIDRLNKN